MRSLTYIIPTLLAIWFVDARLSRDRTAGWERNSVINSMKRWDQRPRAKVAILGSSTSKDWLDARFLAPLVGVAPHDVLDAHINGCHQDCTYAEVRLLQQRKVRFEAVFFGLNLFQQCEFAHTKRVLQQEMMLPTGDIPGLFAIYWEGEQPLQLMGRFLGMKLSGAYADTAVVQSEAAKALFGPGKRGQAHRWARPRVVARTTPLGCSYDDDAIALKVAYTEQVLDDLGEISKRVYLMLLPDRTLDTADEALRERWARHRALHAQIAAARPHVTLVDLVTDGVGEPRKYRDDIHLNPAGVAEQRRLFAARMKALRPNPP